MKILAQLSNRGPLGEFGSSCSSHGGPRNPLTVGPATHSSFFPAAHTVGPAIHSPVFPGFLTMGPALPSTGLCAALIAGPAILCPVFPAVPVLMDNKTIKKVVS